MNKLFNHVFIKGDVIIYWDRKARTEKNGVYISHHSYSAWHNGIEHPNCRHTITIIKTDGSQDITDWIKPLNK